MARTTKVVVALLVSGLVALLAGSGCNELGLGGAGGESCEGTGGDGAVCEIAAQSPCEEQCQADYDSAALECGSIQSDAERTSCQDGAYQAYKQCRAACTADPVEQCKKLCDKENAKCIAQCPKGDKGCMSQCNNVYAKCLKDCEK